jgi:hypothetical protein
VVAEPSRRIVLAAMGTVAAATAGSAGLAGCKGIAALGPVPGLPPDVVTLEHAITAEHAIVASYAAALGKLATITGQDGNSTVLRTVAGIHAQHQAHLRQLRGRLVLPSRLAKSKLGAGRQSSPMPDSQAGVLGALAAGERAAAARLTIQLLDVPPALAQLMASIAASEAAHAVFLRRAGGA